MAGNVLVVFES